eukprot:COSAG05_NODE_315_length_11604_cov_8.336375_6_plen_1129_part_00
MDRGTTGHPLRRRRGDKTRNTHAWTDEQSGWIAKFGYLLVADSTVLPTEVLASLPSVEEIICDCVTCDSVVSCSPFQIAIMGYNVFAIVASVCEKLDQPEMVLTYTAAGLETDVGKLGTNVPTSRALLQVMQGRALAALGRTMEAAATLEGAAEEARRCKLWMLVALALRDLKLCVLDQIGHGEHGARRLGSVLRLLKGPPERLTTMMKGLDAAALMDLPEPEAGHTMSPFPPLGTVVSVEEDASVVTLRRELGVLKLFSLQKRALKEGISEDKVEEAMDGGEPKAQLIKLLMEHRDCMAAAASVRAAEMRRNLQRLTLTKLMKRAASQGVAEDQIEAAVESNDPKAALVELIVAIPESKSARPHFGSAVSASAAPKSQTTITKHVMLSYQWDHQRQVQRVFELLTGLGLKVWMDTQGGMATDVYDSMAEGVSNASVVVCFMSAKYQESANCMLELKFAKQSGVEIVPALMEGGGWKASGWLGLLTAGSLWTPLHEEASFENNVQMLHGQIQQVVGLSATDDMDETETGLDMSNDEAKEELARLRDDLVETSQASAFAMADPSQPATIPASVPKLPARFQPTEQIRELTRLVLSTTASDMAMPRVGFFGMGGIGKTVTGAAIARNDRVRQHFDAIVWLPLGQTPMFAKLQNLCHMQCTGKELSAELSSEERKEALQQAMSGKRILLCLDDLWEEQHETELNFVDVFAGSKVLISTRIQALLAEAHQVEVGLPSVADSVRMLLSAAGMGDGDEPTGVREVVGLCGRLPLALGIAGRLAASLGLVGAETRDWSDMIGVLKDELRESHSGGTEEGMIRASLRGLRGSAQEQENVRALLNMFALVPEDTHCPLEMLLLIFKATIPGSEATSIMHIRKWLRILLNRSLVLGTIDRPSVHDLVLDFAVAQHSAEELLEKHRSVIEAFRKARPSNAAGVSMYDYVNNDDPMTAYVISNAAHHAKGSHRANNASSEKLLLSWLHDQPKDLLCNAISAVLGEDKLQYAADSAEASGEMWPSACWWAAAATVQGSRPGLNSNFITYYLRAGQALSKARLQGTDYSALAFSASQIDHLELIVTNQLVMYDLAHLSEYMKAMERLLETEVGKARPDLYLNYYVSAIALLRATSLTLLILR